MPYKIRKQLEPDNEQDKEIDWGYICWLKLDQSHQNIFVLHKVVEYLFENSQIPFCSQSQRVQNILAVPSKVQKVRRKKHHSSKC